MKFAIGQEVLLKSNKNIVTIVDNNLETKNGKKRFLVEDLENGQTFVVSPREIIRLSWRMKKKLQEVSSKE